MPINTPTAVMASQMMKIFPPAREKNGFSSGSGSGASSSTSGSSDDMDEPRHEPECPHRTPEAGHLRSAGELAGPRVGPLGARHEAERHRLVLAVVRLVVPRDGGQRNVEKE